MPMKINRKISIIFIYILLSISFISQFPESSGIYIPYPISRSSIKTSDVSDAFITRFGHDLDEPYWSLIYDFLGEHVVQDFNPEGPYVSNRTIGDIDSKPLENASFFMAWNKFQNIHNFYFAMQNYSWIQPPYNFYGCAPYQYFMQHFRIPITNTHIFALNKFLGLLAYKENESSILPDIPDENDELFIGWPQFSEYHKWYINFLFQHLNIPDYYWIDDTKNGTAEPIEMTYDNTTNIYKFGMSYKNIFILWQNIEVKEGLNQSVDNATILNNCSAFSMISSINFTFTISITNTLFGKQVKTSTEYDIGELDELWVIGDDNSTSGNFGGTSFNISIPEEAIEKPIGHYNTSDVIKGRLNGTMSTPGFGLAVINTANIAVVKMRNFLK